MTEMLVDIYLCKFCLTVFFIHPEEDQQVGRNIGVLQKRVSSSFVFSIYIYFYIYIYTRLQKHCYFRNIYHIYV